MYRFYLTNGHVHEGDDERDPEDILRAIVRADDDELPKGWIWLASLYIRPEQIIGFELLPIQ